MHNCTRDCLSELVSNQLLREDSRLSSSGDAALSRLIAEMMPIRCCIFFLSIDRYYVVVANIILLSLLVYRAIANALKSRALYYNAHAFAATSTSFSNAGP